MLTIRSLSGNHKKSEFDCGRAELNEWLVRFARQHQDKGLSQTFVAVDPDAPGRILGYYALTACEIVAKDLPPKLAAKLPRKIPGIRLGRLAVEASVQGQGVGELLLMDAIRRSCTVKDSVGVHALFVDAKDEAAAAFYRHYGFAPFPDSPNTLVLPFSTICSPGLHP